MPEWYRPYILVIALMVTSFVTIGVLALSSATSRRQRLIRAAIVLLVPAPLLFRQAYELYSVFAIQILLVFAGVALNRRRTLRHQSDPTRTGIDPSLSPLQPRFSLSTLLLLTAAIGICLTAVIQLPKWENLAWRTSVISGVGAAAGTLAGAWLCFAKRKWVVTPVAMVACIAIGIAVSKLDWFFEATLQMAGWPPRPITPALLMGSPSNYDSFDAWTFIPLLVALLTAILISLWRAATNCGTANSSSSAATQGTLKQCIAQLGFVTLALPTIALPVVTMVAILSPAPVPEVSMPAENGHNDFRRAAKVASDAKVHHISDIFDISVEELSKHAAPADEVNRLVAAGLEKPCILFVDYWSMTPYSSAELVEGYHAVAAALFTAGRLAEFDHRYDDALRIHLRNYQFGHAASRGALVWQAGLLKGRAAYGTRGIYAMRHKLTDDQLAFAIEQLLHIDVSDEPTDDIIDRYRVWAQRRNGWHGHLKYLLETVAVDPGNGLCSDFWHCETFKNHYRRSHATTRLLVCELALLRFHREHAHYPASLEELVPKYLPSVPADPFDPQAEPLRYRLLGDDYLLYSVSQNGVDNRGIPWVKGEKIPGTTGDLRLDIAFTQ